MKISFVLVLLLLNLTLSGATYYVSPSGSDSNPGTISQPFFTLNKAWKVISGGDIVHSNLLSAMLKWTLNCVKQALQSKSLVIL